jgi:mono/diheme cytochrome c family protein
MDRGIEKRLFIRPFLLVVLSLLVLTGSVSSTAFGASDLSDQSFNWEFQIKENVILVQHGGPPEGRGPKHGGGGRHCPEMSREGGCPGGGMGHRGGMGMHHGGGQAGAAQCPQPRATVTAPDEFYNLVNPLENSSDNIEKGRLLFTLDVQPTCVMCHGNAGDRTGGFGADMSPKPRNFTCTEMMKEISDGQLFWVIKNGSPDTGMPPFQDLKDEQIWHLILFIRSLAK